MFMIQKTNDFNVDYKQKFVLFDKFLTANACNDIIQKFESQEKQYAKLTASELWCKDVDTPDISETETIEFKDEIVIEYLKNFIKNEFKEDVNYDQGFLVKAFPGSSVMWHNDVSSKSVDLIKKDPNIANTQKLHELCPSIGLILYLNEEYEGGEIELKNGLLYKPKTGSLLAFHGSVHEHRVKPTTDFRYIIVTWWSL